MRIRKNAVFKRLSVWIWVSVFIVGNLCPQTVFCVQAEERTVQEEETTQEEKSTQEEKTTQEEGTTESVKARAGQETAISEEAVDSEDEENVQEGTDKEEKTEESKDTEEKSEQKDDSTVSEQSQKTESKDESSEATTKKSEETILSKEEVRKYLQLDREYGFGTLQKNIFTAGTASEKNGKAAATVEDGSSVAVALNPDLNTVLSKTGSYVLGVDTNPDFNSCWNVVALTRSGLSVSSTYKNTFYKNVYTYLEQNNWVLSKTKYSEYSKLIVAMTAIGKDAQDIGGHNLLAYLSDFSNVKKQGMNGPIWALIALNSHSSYSIPTDSSASEQTTEDGLVSYLLEKKISTGGWSLDGSKADADITGMTIQALAPYYNSRADVKSAIDQALVYLSDSQLSDGGYANSDGSENAETVAQVVVALTSLGIDPSQDDRFIKSGKWPMTALFQFYLSQGGFSHQIGDSADTLATAQGMYAASAYRRLLDGKTSLYDMSDISLTSGEKIEVKQTEATTSAGVKETSGTSVSLKVAVKQLTVNYTSISVIKGKTKNLKVVVSPASATNKSVKWKSSNTKVATVTQKGVVKGVKTGSALITVTAKDGSGVSTTCKVSVLDTSSGSVSTTTTTTTSTTAVSGSTKKLGTTITKTLGTASTKTLGNASATSSGNNSQTGDSSEGGWSFGGADYVPETSSGDGVGTEEFVPFSSTEAEKRWSDKTIKLEIPLGAVFYSIVGAVGLLVIEGLIWFIRKKRKEKVITK